MVSPTASSSARQAEEQLVEVVRPLVEADLRDRDHEQRRLGPHERRVDDVRVRDLLRLRAVPAAPLDERLQLLVRDELDLAGGDAVGDHSRSSGCISWNQKNPRGASVSRYGRLDLRNAVRPNISVGTQPSYHERSSSTACADRARLWTQRTTSSS